MLPEARVQWARSEHIRVRMVPQRRLCKQGRLARNGKFLGAREQKARIACKNQFSTVLDCLGCRSKQSSPTRPSPLSNVLRLHSAPSSAVVGSPPAVLQANREARCPGARLADLPGAGPRNCVPSPCTCMLPAWELIISPQATEVVKKTPESLQSSSVSVSHPFKIQYPAC